LLQYVEHVDGLRSVRIYGVPGQAQHGIDLYGTDEAGETVAYQAKNVKTFTAASLRAAVKKFNDEPPPVLDVKRLIVCTACPTNDITVGQELARLRKANRKLNIDLYDQTVLSEGLRGRPDLVRRLFGAAWQIGFCDQVGWEVPERTPIDALADSLVRGPLVAFGLVDALNEADAVAAADPGHAAELLGRIITRMAEEGFPGSTSTLRRQRAELLLSAGQMDGAISVFSELAWASRTEAGVDDDQRAEGRLRALAQEHSLPEVTLFVSAIDAVDQWHQQPDVDLERVIDLTLQLDAAGHQMAAELVLWCAETAVADRHVLRDGPLIDAVNRHITQREPAGLGDEITVRLRTAVADLGGDWTSLLRDARAGWLGARMATVVHARYGRHLLLNGQPDDAQVEYSAAVGVACQAQLGHEAANALYSITQTRMRYGPLDKDPNTLSRMAIDLRRQGHTFSLLPGRDPADSGAEALASGRIPSAFRYYRAAIRHCVIRGDFAGEVSAHHHVAEILLQSGEPAAAIRHIIRCGGADLAKKQLVVPTYVDLRSDVLDGPHWERATALDIAATECDLIPDDHVQDYFTVALAATAEPNRSLFGPHVSLAGWKVIAGLASRLAEVDAVTILTKLEPFIERKPNTYHFNDEDHVAAVALIYDSHSSLAPRAAKHLAQLVTQEHNLGETVRRAVRRWVDDPATLLDALRPHAAKHDAAASILSDYGERAEESLAKVRKKISARLTAPPPEPGHFSFGTDLPALAQRARDLEEPTRKGLIEYCMTLAEDESRPSSNRAEGMEGVALLARSIDDETRDQMFDRTLPIARLDLPETAIDRMLSSTHPLSSFKVDLDNGALPRLALQALGQLAHTAEQARVVQERAMAWLTGDDRAINAVAHTLNRLDPAEVTIDLTLLASHPSQWLRQISAVLAARSNPPAAAVLDVLACDPDRQVRRTVGQLISRVAIADKKLAKELRQRLKADVSWSVRRAAAEDVSLDRSSPGD
jgi:hypothetical protein